MAKGDRVRVRVGNLTMTNHPIHMHGYDFEVTCTDGGWVRPEARWPEVTIDIPVGAMRAYEFDAIHPGDWAIHCHKSHHTMNAMGHDVRNFIGVDKKAVRQTDEAHWCPTTCRWAAPAWPTWARWRCRCPTTRLPMMTGFGQFGAVEMGGMFSVVKVREGLASGDYKDPGWYKHPARHGRLRMERARPPATPRALSPVPAGKAGPMPRAVKPITRFTQVDTRRRIMKPTNPDFNRCRTWTGLWRRRWQAPATSPARDTAHADDTAYGKPGDPKKPARIVQIVFREDDGKMLFLPDNLKVRKGEQIRFQLRNNGEVDHEFVVGTVEENLKHMKEMEKNPDMEHDDPNAKRLKPKATGEILWQFTKAGTFDFSCLIPGHRQAGMFGTIVVE